MLQQLQDALNILHDAHKKMEEKKKVKKSLFEKLMNKLWRHKWQYSVWVIDSSKHCFFANPELKEFVEPQKRQYVTRFWFTDNDRFSSRSNASF